MNPAMNTAVNALPVATPFFFYMLSGLAIASGLAVITRRNAVHSALALIVTLLSVAGLYLMLYAPFVAGVQIIVYAGGIMVLFLFVIMLVNIDRSSKERQFNRMWPIGLVAACKHTDHAQHEECGGYDEIVKCGNRNHKSVVRR